MTPEAQQEAEIKFRYAPQSFAGAIGAIDCTHIAIHGPKEHEHTYVNHHGYHSLNVQMICDPNLNILNVNARYPGARHDAFIWSVSPVRRVMERGYHRGQKYFLIGDQGYPLEPWLMTPLPHEREGTPRYLYNAALCSVRSCIERTFGVLKSTWRCLLRDRVLQYEPGKAGKIVNACAILHNMRNHHNVPNSFEIVDEEPTSDNNVGNNEHIPSLAAARRVQERLI
ncbi:putative nuclease HARBI1 [Prorops nasuta]|uniref:putative nuclease HARBI1 n=1 Tax=Prorops nasuta TaxID=863751 RepID=UPI0034CDA451